VHAGLIATLSDHTAGYASYTLIPKNRRILTVEYKINFLALRWASFWSAVPGSSNRAGICWLRSPTSMQSLEKPRPWWQRLCSRWQPSRPRNLRP